MTTHRSTSFLDRVLDFASMFEGARSAAVSVNSGRKPHPDALRRLGIEQGAFERVRFY